MSTVSRSRPVVWLSGCVALVGLSLRRALWSRSSIVGGVLAAFACLVVVAWSMHHDANAARFVARIVVPLYVSFLLPIYCLSYAAPVIAGLREDRTLVYVVTLPYPRWLSYSARCLAAGTAATLWTLGSGWLLCRLAGPAGAEVWPWLWKIVLAATWAYVGLFSLASVLFRRATIVALAYTIFLEVLLGAMPGIVKRVAVSFYVKCAIFEAAEPLHLVLRGPHRPRLFVPITGGTALTVLWTSSVVLLVIGAVIFSRREYRE